MTMFTGITIEADTVTVKMDGGHWIRMQIRRDRSDGIPYVDPVTETKEFSDDVARLWATEAWGYAEDQIAGKRRYAQML